MLLTRLLFDLYKHSYYVLEIAQRWGANYRTYRTIHDYPTKFIATDKYQISIFKRFENSDNSNLTPKFTNIVAIRYFLSSSTYNLAISTHLCINKD